MSDAADQQPPAVTPPDELLEPTEKRYSKLLRKKRSEFLDHLLRSLDMVAYCHFSYLYFLEYPFNNPPLPSPPGAVQTAH